MQVSTPNFDQFRKAVSPGLVPLFLALLFAIFIICYRLVGLPPPAEMAQISRLLYDRYGIAVVLVAAFIEAIFMINFYFPGSFVIVLAVIVSNKTPASLSVIGLTAWAGFSLAGFVNYSLGQSGFYRILLRLGKKDTVLRMREWMDRRGKMAVFLAAIHPNFLAIAQVCMGIAREGLKKTMLFSISSLALWVPLWTVVFAVVGEQIDLEDPNQAWYIVGVFLLWALIAIMKGIVKGGPANEGSLPGRVKS